MATSPERKIEDALVSAISALSYTATSVSVRGRDDMDEEKTSPMVQVYCANAQRLEPNWNYYRTDIEISTQTHVPNDESNAVSENMYDAVNDYVQFTLTAAALTTSINDAKITIDGFVPQQNEDDYEDNWRMNAAVLECFYTYTT